MPENPENLTNPVESLSPKQAAFLASLMSGSTITAASEAAEVTERTAYRWLATPDFQAAYRAARREAVQAATARLQQAASQAVETLCRNLECGDPPVEVRAAVAVLQQSFKATELEDVSERLAQMETALSRLVGKEPV